VADSGNNRIEKFAGAGTPGFCAMTFGKLKRNKKKGTARLTVSLPGPGTASLSGAGVASQRSIEVGGVPRASIGAAGPVSLVVKPKHKTRKKLKKKHKANVTVAVTFTPAGGVTSNTQTERIKLIKKG
jgi:hypothetical protein